MKPVLARGAKEIEEEYRNTNWFIEIKRLRIGESFGELALIKDVPRAATITCTEEASFAVLDKESYKRVLLKSELKAKAKIDDFLQSIPLFKSWNRR
jgi:CRP-like cAMP-binding protein